MHSKRWIFSLISIFFFIFSIITTGVYYYHHSSKDPFSEVSSMFFLLIGILIYFLLSKLFFLKKFNMNHAIDSIIQKAFSDVVIQMIIIFILSGAFSGITSGIGCSKELVDVILQNIPHGYILCGIFIASAFISTGLGTSFGTVVVIGPIVVLLADLGAISMIMGASCTISGAYFGDNLSLISDTTISCIKTQNADLRKKLFFNAKIALPLSAIVLLIYFFNGNDNSENINIIQSREINLWLISPYIIVILLGLLRVNVIFILLFGILWSYLIALHGGNFSVTKSIANFATKGVINISELVAYTVLVAFLNGIVQESGLFEKITQTKTSNFKKKPNFFKASMILLSLFTLMNIITANNTISIILLGTVVSKMFEKFNFSHKNSYIACIMDNFTCGIHGLLPHAPQIMLMASFTKLSTFDIVSKSYYCMGLVVFTVVNCYLKGKNKNVT